MSWNDERPFDQPRQEPEAILCDRCQADDAFTEFRGLCLCPNCYEEAFEADCDAQEQARLDD